MYLDRYTVGDYTPGASLWKQLLWFFVGDLLVRSRLFPFSGLKVWVLRRFGAAIGQGVRIKPGVRIKFPWRLTIGNYCWIGEETWLDNVAPITLEDHVCLSQGVYLCTGNHDWSDPHFQLRLASIYIESGSWIAARAVVGPGVRVGYGAVLGLGSVATRSLEAMTIYAGNPAASVKKRITGS
jgi:putative colanic acid biosynthesis acetyltransferase WcaF